MTSIVAHDKHIARVYPCVRFLCAGWNATESIRTYVQNKFGATDKTAYRKLAAEWHREVSAQTVAEADKKTVMWQPSHIGELGDWAETFATLPDDTVFMTWMDSSSAVQAFAEAGHQVRQYRRSSAISSYRHCDMQL